MNIWNNFVAYAMQKELLSQLGQVHADVPLPLAPHNTMPWTKILAKMSWDDFGDDFPDFDSPNKRVAAEDAQHYCGTVQGPFGAVCKHFEITGDGVCHRIRLDDKTLCQRYFFKENERLHIYADQTENGPVARLVMDDDAFSAARYFHGPDFDLSVAEDFLHLDTQRQTAYTRLVTDEALRKSVLCGLSYVATRIADDHTAPADILFPPHIVKKAGCADIAPELLRTYARDLFDSAQDEPHSDAFTSHNTSGLLSLILFAIIRGFSAWHEQGLTTPRILIEKLSSGRRFLFRDILCTTADPKLLDSVLTELIEAFPDYPASEEIFNDIFFGVCRQSTCLSDTALHRMCDLMFQDGIYQSQTQQMDKVLSGPNGKRFRSYIMDRFADACNAGVARYHFCAAAIVNAQRHCARKNLPEEAARGITQSTTTQDYLLNVLCLGLLAWDALIGHKYYAVKKLVLKQKTVTKLVSHLSTPDRLFFPIVACAVHDLMLCEVISTTVLGEAERQAALRALEDEQTRRRAEELLSLIALPAAPPATSNTELLQKYLTRFEASLRDPKSDEKSEQLYAVLCHLGAFPTAQERREQLDRIIRRFAERKAYADGDTKWRIGNLIRSVAPFPHIWTDTFTQVDPAALDQPLSKERTAELAQLSSRLEEEDRTYRVTDTGEALDIIKFISSYAYALFARNKPEPSGLGRHVLLELPNPGSYIIVKWFQILCMYAPGPRALAYYHDHHQVLDLPANLSFSSSLGSSNRALYELYKTFLQSRPRALEGILCAMSTGNLDVISAFMDSQYRPLVDNLAFVNAILNNAESHNHEEALCKIYEGRHGTDEALARRKRVGALSQKLDNELAQLISQLQKADKTPVLPDKDSPILKPAELSSLQSFLGTVEYAPTNYYDDLTILANTLLRHPHLHPFVMALGYDQQKLTALATSAKEEPLPDTPQA